MASFSGPRDLGPMALLLGATPHTTNGHLSTGQMSYGPGSWIPSTLASSAGPFPFLEIPPRADRFDVGNALVGETVSPF